MDGYDSAVFSIFCDAFFKIYNICTLLGCFQAFSPFWIPTFAPHHTRKFSQACVRSGGGRVREGLPGVEHRRPLVARIADGQDVAPAVLQPRVDRLDQKQLVFCFARDTPQMQDGPIGKIRDFYDKSNQINQFCNFQRNLVEQV